MTRHTCFGSSRRQSTCFSGVGRAAPLLALFLLAACDDDDALESPQPTSALPLETPSDETTPPPAQDTDRDGYGLDDCDDANAAVHPGANELCNERDDNCDGMVDNEAVDATDLYPDLDEDGRGDASGEAVVSCSSLSGYVGSSDDCDDEDADIHPGADETCNQVDDDCDGLTDDDDDDVIGQGAFFQDADGDGIGGYGSPVYFCEAPEGYASSGSDCDDLDPARYPGATEICNALDENCNGLADDGVVYRLWYLDLDEDGYGTEASTVSDCKQPAGFAAEKGDCDDASPAVYPGVAESCNGVDDNCNAETDEGVKLTFYGDADGDGYGDPDKPLLACEMPSGAVANSSDCNDVSPQISPGGAESCNGVDDDCDGSIDEGVLASFYLDQDGDGHGAGTAVSACSPPQGYVVESGDCNDYSEAIYPAALEVCNGLDDNCDGKTDTGNTVPAYADGDGDGYGAPVGGTPACLAEDAVFEGGDCDDTESAVYPDALEIPLNARDENCDGRDGYLTAVDCGYNHTLMIDDSRNVWAVGGDDWGQLGIGGYENVTVPVQVYSLKDVIQVDAGYISSLALTADGTVYSWGANWLGGGWWFSDVPERVDDLPPIVDIASGDGHFLALDAEGILHGWGFNDYGQLGVNGDYYAYPVEVEGISGVVDIDAGAYHSLAITSDGKAWAWGANDQGQLGNGTTNMQDRPVKVKGLGSVKGLMGGVDHSLAILQDGTLMAWGNDSANQLGDDAGGSRLEPEAVAGLTSVSRVLAGGDHTVVFQSDGRACGFGVNERGQLGLITQSYSSPLTRLASLDGAAGGSGGHLFTYLLTKEGKAISFGSNGAGQLGDGTFRPVTSSSPLSVEGLPDVVAVEAGDGLSLAVGSDGSVLSWGLHSDGYDAWAYNLPIYVEGAEDIVALSAHTHVLGLTSAGTVLAWGSNVFGELGLGDTLPTPSAQEVPALNHVTAVAAGLSFSLALKDDGTVWAWGTNESGQLGTDYTPSPESPRLIAEITDAVAIAAGTDHALALRSNGTVLAWGQGGYGQLGTGDLWSASSPVAVPDLRTVVAIAAGNGNSFAVTSDGSVYSWGSDAYGALGNGTDGDQSTPTKMDLTNVRSLEAGEWHVLAIKKDNSVWGWGYNGKGSLGDGTTTDQQSPILLSSLHLPGSGARKVLAAGTAHSLFLDPNLSAMAFGNNSNLELGQASWEPREVRFDLVSP